MVTKVGLIGACTALTVLFGASIDAHAEPKIYWNVEVHCESQDDGQMTVTLPAAPAQNGHTNLVYFSPEVPVGEMPLSKVKVFAYLEARRGHVGFDGEIGSISVNTDSGWGSAVIRQVLFESSLYVTLDHPGIADPEGLDCRITPIRIK